MQKMIFVNLPVTDLAATTRFYEAIGCQKNEQFSNEKAVSMVWSDTIFFMLLTRPFFETFTPRAIADGHHTTEVLISLSMESRQKVDEITEAAASAGGRADLRERQDHGFMYGRSCADPDGHIFEPVWMDPAFAAGGQQQGHA